MRGKLILLVIGLLLLSVITGCGEEAQDRTVASSETSDTTSVKKTTTSPKASSRPASDFDGAVAQCDDAVDTASCLLSAVQDFNHEIDEQNTYAYVNVCKRIPAGEPNPGFVAESFDWGTYPTLRLQCFREIMDDIILYGKAEFVAKELCDDLEGHGIPNDGQYRDYCYIEVADARKEQDPQGAEELCYQMPDSLMQRTCCQTVYGKFNNDADRCTKA